MSPKKIFKLNFLFISECIWSLSEWVVSIVKKISNAQEADDNSMSTHLLQVI